MADFTHPHQMRTEDMAKVEGSTPQRVDRPGEPEEKKAQKKEDKEDFKKLLAKKKDGDEQGRAKKGQTKKARTKEGKNASKSALGDKGSKGAPARRGGEFSERLRDGRQQLGEQHQRRSRVDTERHTSRQYDEKRLDDTRADRHWRDVDKGEAKKHERRLAASGDKAGQKQANAGRASAHRRGADGRGLQAADPGVGALSGQRGRAQGAGKGEKAAPMQRSEMREQVAKLAEKLVEKAHVGQDAAGRQIMLLDLQVPGRGNVRVRLRRRGEGFEVRMRAENEELGRDLRREREQFRQTASENGVEFTSIEVV